MITLTKAEADELAKNAGFYHNKVVRLKLREGMSPEAVQLIINRATRDYKAPRI